MILKLMAMIPSTATPTKTAGVRVFTQQLYFDSLMNKFVLNHVQIHEIKSPIFYPTSVHQS